MSKGKAKQEGIDRNVVNADNTIPARERRQASTGSVYPIKTIRKDKNKQDMEVIKWGFCITLNKIASTEQKKKYGSRLRYLKSSYNSYTEAVAGVAEAISNIDKILEDKLKKLGWEERDDIKADERQI